jgi:hypothetical protein
MMCSEGGLQRLWIQIPLHAIGRSRLSESPKPLEWELDVGVYDDGDCLIQTGFCNVPLIDEGEFESIQILNERAVCVGPKLHP